MKNFIYLLTPVIAWLIAGVLKFCVNSIKSNSSAFEKIGYGGMPSNHSAIVSSMASMIFLQEGITHPAFGVAITLLFIVIIDANALRNQIGKQAKVINSLNTEKDTKLRESMGHSKLEILAGLILGFVISWLISILI